MFAPSVMRTCDGGRYFADGLHRQDGLSKQIFCDRAAVRYPLSDHGRRSQANRNCAVWGIAGGGLALLTLQLPPTMLCSDSEGELLINEPEDSTMLQVWERHAQAWRDQHGVSSDEDFAFYFTSVQEVVRISRPLAFIWQRVRQSQEQVVAQEAARSAQLEASLSRKRKVPQVDARFNAFTNKKAARKATTTQPAPRIVLRENALTQLQEALRPGLTALAVSQLDRRLEVVVKQAEPQTVHRVVATLQELGRALDAAGIAADQVEAAWLEDFVWKSESKHRVYASLKWAANNLKVLQEPLKLVMSPTASKNRFGQSQQQAVCVEPAMVKLLEQAMEEMAAASNAQWTVVAAAWIQAKACMRLVHLRRSMPIRLTATVLHCRCLRGKQAHNRVGFEWACPALTSGGYPVGQAFLEAWRKLKDPNMVMVFSLVTKTSVSNAAVSEQARLVLSEEVETASLSQLTTYSWRRYLPTLGHVLGMPPQDLGVFGRLARSFFSWGATAGHHAIKVFGTALPAQPQKQTCPP